MKKGIRLVAILIAMVFLGGCQAKQVVDNKKETSIAKTAHEKVNYDDQEEWEFASGNMQSPINIQTNKVSVMTPDDGKLTLSYCQKITRVENTGHSIQVTDAGQAIINGRSFKLTQFHFHAKSEHTINGNHYPLEAHFVNMSQDGRIAVIAIFFKEGAENSGFNEVLADVSDKKNNPITHINQMMPENKSYYHYLGSLTTPPLTENVEWYVLKEPVDVSAAQIASFQTHYKHNNRKIQPLNDRQILENNE